MWSLHIGINGSEIKMVIMLSLIKTAWKNPGLKYLVNLSLKDSTFSTQPDNTHRCDCATLLHWLVQQFGTQDKTALLRILWQHHKLLFSNQTHQYSLIVTMAMQPLSSYQGGQTWIALNAGRDTEQEEGAPHRPLMPDNSPAASQSAFGCCC